MIPSRNQFHPFPDYPDAIMGGKRFDAIDNMYPRDPVGKCLKHDLIAIDMYLADVSCIYL